MGQGQTFGSTSREARTTGTIARGASVTWRADAAGDGVTARGEQVDGCPWS